MMEFAQRLKADAEWLEEALDQALPVCHGEQASVVEAMRYSLLGGGKRLRGALIIVRTCKVPIRQKRGKGVGQAGDRSPKGLLIDAERGKRVSRDGSAAQSAGDKKREKRKKERASYRYSYSDSCRKEKGTG